MALTITNQELITVTLTASGATVTQQESLWSDLGAYQDLYIQIFFAQLPAWTNNPQLYIETAPLKEEALFTTATNQLITISANPANYPGWNVYGPFHLSSGTSFCRFLRWRIFNGTAAGPNTFQFRVLLSVNPSPH